MEESGTVQDNFLTKAQLQISQQLLPGSNSTCHICTSSCTPHVCTCIYCPCCICCHPLSSTSSWQIMATCQTHILPSWFQPSCYSVHATLHYSCTLKGLALKDHLSVHLSPIRLVLDRGKLTLVNASRCSSAYVRSTADK